jgi:hypothetical protein
MSGPGRPKSKPEKEERKKDEDSKESKDARLQRIIARLRPKVQSLLDKKRSRPVASTVLAALRAWYRLTRLAAEGQGRGSVQAVLNPSGRVESTSDVKVALDNKLKEKPDRKKRLDEALNFTLDEWMLFRGESTIPAFMAQMEAQLNKLNAAYSDTYREEILIIREAERRVRQEYARRDSLGQYGLLGPEQWQGWPGGKYQRSEDTQAALAVTGSQVQKQKPAPSRSGEDPTEVDLPYDESKMPDYVALTRKAADLANAGKDRKLSRRSTTRDETDKEREEREERSRKSGKPIRNPGKNRSKPLRASLESGEKPNVKSVAEYANRPSIAEAVRISNITSGYKNSVRAALYNYLKQMGSPPGSDLHMRVMKRFEAMDPDHVIEIQTGGGDWWENLRMTDGPTNRNMGSELHFELDRKNVGEGTLIVVNITGLIKP